LGSGCHSQHLGRKKGREGRRERGKEERREGGYKRDEKIVARSVLIA
jgi:hypothetical protein